MANHTRSSIFHSLWKWIHKNGEDGQQTGSHSGHQNPDGSTSESRIADFQRARRATLIRQAENLCTATKAQNDAVLGRLGLSVQDVTLPSPQPPPVPKRSARFFRRGRKIAPLPDVPCFKTEDVDRLQSPGSPDEKDDSFWEKVRLGSQMAVLACKEAQLADRDQSPTSTLSSVDCQTPSELRAIPLIEDPRSPPLTPPPRTGSLFRRRTSHLPVYSAEHSGAEKEVADGCWLQSAKGKFADRDRSPTSTLSSIDCQTPSELRAIPLIEDPRSPPPPLTPPPRTVRLFTRRTSRLPVYSAKHSGAEKEVADGCWLQSATGKFAAFAERLKGLQLASIPLPRPLAAPKITPAASPKRIQAPPPMRRPEPAHAATPVEMPLAPTPPKVPKAQKQGTRPGVALRPAKAVGVAGKETATDCCPNAAKVKKVKKTELQPLTNPVESLSTCFKLLSSDDWEKKIDGLKIVQALVQHHPDTLKNKLHEVCLVLIEEVNNLRSAVACEAMTTVAELHIHLEKAMDPEAEGTGRALLLKLAQTTNAFIHQQANLALDALVDNCSHGRILSALLNAGLSHRCAAVRGSMAQHLHQLADNLGAAHILTAGRTFTERFLLAVSKMCVDGAPEVRHHGQKVLLQLADHKDFLKLWMKIVPENERRSLDKILKKAKK